MSDIVAKFSLSENDNIDAIFKIAAAGTTWGSIDGTLSNQKDLQAALNLKADKLTVESDLETINNTITENYNTLDTKIESVNSNLSSDITTLSGTVSANNTAVNNRINSLETSTDADILELNTHLSDLAETVEDNYTALNTAIQNEATTRANNDTLLQNSINLLENNLSTEVSDRTTADNTLSQTISNNYLELSGNIGELETTVNDNYTNLDDKITTLSNTVDNNNTAINNKVDGINTTLSDSISALSSTVSNNYTTLDNKIDTTKTALDRDISNLTDTVTQNYTDLNSAITNSASTINSRIDNEVSTLNTFISAEETARVNANNNLQSQIDAITSASDVTDIVGTYAQLQAYDTTSLPNNSIIKVLSDESRDDETTYYRWVISNSIGAWVLIGEEGPYYTKSEADSTFVPQARTINNKPLSNNITLTASDVNALPDTTVIGDGVLVLQKNGTTIDTFSANATTGKTINITVPIDTSDLTNNAGFLTSADLTALESTVGSNTSNINTLTSRLNAVDLTLNGKQDELTSDNAGKGISITTVEGVLKISNTQTSAQWGNITGTLVNQTDLQNALNNKYDTSNPAGYITGITSGNVITALGYTPYNSSNPANYTSNIGTVTSVNNILPTDGNVAVPIPTATSELTNDSGFITNVDIDNSTITKNTIDELQAVGVIDDNEGETLKAWKGTAAQFNAIETKSNNTLYYVVDAGQIYCGNTLISSNYSPNIGSVVTSLLPLTDAGLHLLDGTLLSGEGIYSEFVDYIAKLYNAGTAPNCFTIETLWQESVSKYGECGKFVYDEDKSTVRLPKINGILEATTNLSELGNLIKAGLPTHTHTRGTMEITGEIKGSTTNNTQTWGEGIGARSGAFTNSTTMTRKTVGDGTGTGVQLVNLVFTGSEGWTGSTSTGNYSSSIATSTTVQPQTVKVFVYIVVATTAKTDIRVDIDNIATDLNAKAGLADNNNFTGATNSFEGITRYGNNRICNTEVIKGTAPTRSVYWSIANCNDQANEAGTWQSSRLAIAEVLLDPDNRTSMHLGVYKNEVNNGTLTGIFIEVDNNGSTICSPTNDNNILLGTASIRWKQLYAGTTAINTSDERLKQGIENVPDEVLDAWGEVEFCQYKFNDAVEEKGIEKARLHTGLIAQRIERIFTKHNLNAKDYGLLCYDEWEAQPAEVDEKGEIHSEAIEAGNRYSLRYEECLCMEATYQRRRADKIEERLKRLEEIIITKFPEKIENVESKAN